MTSSSPTWITTVTARSTLRTSALASETSWLRARGGAASSSDWRRDPARGSELEVVFLFLKCEGACKRFQQGEGAKSQIGPSPNIVNIDVHQCLNWRTLLGGHGDSGYVEESLVDHSKLKSMEVSVKQYESCTDRSGFKQYSFVLRLIYISWKESTSYIFNSNCSGNVFSL